MADGIYARIDDRELRKTLNEMAKRGKDPVPFYKWAAGKLQFEVLKNFRMQGHYGDVLSGDPLTNTFRSWKPLSMFAQLVGHKSSVFAGTGRMRGSIGSVRNISKDGLVWGTNIGTGPIHHFGSKGLPGGVIRPRTAKFLAIPWPGVRGTARSYFSGGSRASKGVFIAKHIIFQKREIRGKQYKAIPLFSLVESVKIPARPFMTISLDAMASMESMAADYLIGKANF